MLLEDHDLTHEWLDAIDSLQTGDLVPTLLLISEGQKAPELLRAKLKEFLNDPTVTIETNKIGRPNSSPAFGLNAGVELFHIKKILTKERGKRALDVEHFMRRELRTNLSYLRHAIRQGRRLIDGLAENGHKYNAPTREELQKKYPSLFNNII